MGISSSYGGRLINESVPLSQGTVMDMRFSTHTGDSLHGDCGLDQARTGKTTNRTTIVGVGTSIQLYGPTYFKPMGNVLLMRS